MPQRKIVIEPDPILREKSTTIEKVDNELRALLDDMLETMYSAPGIGLAAVQIGILKRVIVIDISKDEKIAKTNKRSIYISKKILMILPILAYGHPVLRKKCKSIEENSKEIKSLISNMWETMYNAEGVGLAAPQIGKSIRLFIIDATPFFEENNVTEFELNNCFAFSTPPSLSISI